MIPPLSYIVGGVADMSRRNVIALMSALAIGLTLAGCGNRDAGSATRNASPEMAHIRHYLSFVDEKADTVDPQCTSGYYTVALNVFDRLVEVRANADGSTEIVPSLAESWDVSPDGLSYHFKLHEGVTFSNGAALTASDVGYTLTRMLTHPNSNSRDIAIGLQGAEAVRDGAAETLSGFHADGDYDFTLTLSSPYAAFLACLSTPGASILDEDTTREAGDRFGHDPAWTVGTGPFVFRNWNEDGGMVLDANPKCWSGAPRCEGLNILAVPDSEAQRLLFEKGELDILDMDNMGVDAEYFFHGDIYQDLLVQGTRVGIAYIALNENIEPLNDIRVRKALQLALNRQTLLDAAYSGRGAVENGIFPRGLIGHNPDLEPIPYDPSAAKALLKEAGLESGFDINFTLTDNAGEATEELVSLISAMWRSIGVRVNVRTVTEDEYYAKRRRGEVACYTATWSADFNDPDNFIYTFFGSPENTLGRSLCYGDREIMDRVRDARAIVDTDARLAEYQALERKIVQEDAAWIPLFSKQHWFVVNRRVDGFKVSWNGWSSNSYRNVAVTE